MLCYFQVCAVASRQNFKSNLHDCCTDVPICCLGFWCPCVLWGQNASFGMGALLLLRLLLLLPVLPLAPLPAPVCCDASCFFRNC